MATKPLARATAQTPPAFACSNLLIGGALRGAERGATFDVVDPSSGAAFARVPDASESDLDDAVAAAAAAFPAWAAAPWAARCDAFAEAAALLEARRDEFADALTREQGKPLRAAQHEVDACVAGFRGAYRRDEPLLRPRATHESATHRYEVHDVPRGVVAAITPRGTSWTS